MVIVHSTFLGGFSTGAFLGRKMKKAEAEVEALGSTMFCLGVVGKSVLGLKGKSIESRLSLDWFKGKIMGNTHISWEKPWFPVDFPLNQSNEIDISLKLISYEFNLRG